MDTGEAVIRRIRSMMQIDDQWSISNGRGYAWWGHRLEQRVWADAERQDYGMAVTRVSAETRVLCDLPVDPRLCEKIAVLNALATLNAYIYDPAASRLSLRCSAYVHEENADWLGRLFGCAVALQAAEAHVAAPALAEAFGARADVSEHSESGPRSTPDDMLNVAASFARNAQSSPYDMREQNQAHEMLRRMGAFATSDASGITAELPFFDDRPSAAGGAATALLQVIPRMKHPQLAGGALLLLKLPITRNDAEAAAISQELNAAETSDEFTRAHQLGAWCARDGVPTFVAFLPAVAYNPGVLTNMVMSMAMRTRFFSEFMEAA